MDKRLMLIGKLLLSIAIISVMMGPLTADLNETHIFNPNWPPHARFHNAVTVFSSIGFTLLGLWVLWKKAKEFKTNLIVAAAIPLLSWAPFFLAILIPGTGAEDHPAELPMVASLPLNLFVALMFSLVTLVGYGLCLYAYSHRSADGTEG